MNAVHLLGRLTNDPELKWTQGGTPYCRFRIAVPRKFAKENDVQADFFNIIAWNKLAEFVSQYFRKGERIIAHGEARNADYKDTNGVKHYAIEFLAEKLEFADTKASKVTADKPEVPAENSEAQAPFNETPF